MVTAPRIIGLIPALAGSRRMKDKNIRRLGGRPLIAHTIQTAADSRVFEAVLVSTDSPETPENWRREKYMRGELVRKDVSAFFPDRGGA